MRVLLIYPDLSTTTTHYTGTLSYAAASLAVVPGEEGHEVGLLHLAAPRLEEEFRARVRAALVRGAEAYRHVRHRAGEHLVRRSPILDRLLGGRDPVWRFREKELAA
jgi:hypothetical protein